MEFAMATMNISLPDKMKKWVEAQVETGRYANVSDYMRDLVRKELEQAKHKAWLENEIERGIASGFSPLNVDELKLSLSSEAIEKAA
jgi:antitoxin ParD1/3/4